MLKVNVNVIYLVKKVHSVIIKSVRLVNMKNSSKILRKNQNSDSKKRYG